jgi:hypothetical protein
MGMRASLAALAQGQLLPWRQAVFAGGELAEQQHAQLRVPRLRQRRRDRSDNQV